MKIRMPEAMTRFKCNLKGCCCRHWQVSFQAADIVRLAKALPQETANEVFRGITVVTGENNTLKSARLRTVGPERACQFLAADGRCGLQDDYGVDVLPHICRAFPGYGMGLEEVTDLCFNVECPEVLNQLDESDDPYTLIELDLEPDHHLAVRARFGGVHPPIQIGERSLTTRELTDVRTVILDALDRREHDALDVLAYIQYALARFAKGHPTDVFEIRAGEPIAPFDAFFDTSVAAHHPQLLARHLYGSQRFVFDLDLATANWAELHEHLVYQPDWRQRLDPRAPKLQPLIFRYLAHRFHSPFSSSASSRALSFAYGTIAHCLATAFRYAVALVSWLDESDTRLLLKVSLGVAEDLGGAMRKTPVTIMPWFDPEQWR